jgi:hypothetical protein
MTGAPAFNSAPDFQGVGALRAWFTDPPGAIVQMARPGRWTQEMAAWMVGPGNARLRGRFPGASGLLLVLDLTLMDGREPGARALMLERASKGGGLVTRIILIPPANANPVYLTTLRAAVTLLKALGKDIKIERSLTKAIAEFGLKPAAVSALV